MEESIIVLGIGLAVGLGYLILLYFRKKKEGKEAKDALAESIEEVVEKKDDIMAVADKIDDVIDDVGDLVDDK